MGIMPMTFGSKRSVYIQLTVEKFEISGRIGSAVMVNTVAFMLHQRAFPFADHQRHFDLFIDQFCIGNLQTGGDLPEGIDGRAGFAFFDLAQHHLADAGKFRQFPQTQVALCPQAF